MLVYWKVSQMIQNIPPLLIATLLHCFVIEEIVHCRKQTYKWNVGNKTNVSMWKSHEKPPFVDQETMVFGGIHVTVRSNGLGQASNGSGQRTHVLLVVGKNRQDLNFREIWKSDDFKSLPSGIRLWKNTFFLYIIYIYNINLYNINLYNINHKI